MCLWPLPLSQKPSCTHTHTHIWWCVCFLCSCTGGLWFLVACQALMSPTLERVHPNGKICVNLFIKAHVGALKVEKKQFLECFKVLQLVDVVASGKYQSTSQPSVHWGWALACIANSKWCVKTANQIQCCHSLVSSKSFFIHTDLWSLHKIIMDMDLVSFTWGFAGKCWCKSGSDSPSYFSIGSLSPPSVQSRGAASWWCQEKTGFHQGTNAAWAIMKIFLGLFLCRYGATFEQVSKHCPVVEQQLPCSVFMVGCFSHQPLLRNDALSFDIVWHILKRALHCFFKASPGSLPSMDPFPSSILRAQLHSCDP